MLLSLLLLAITAGSVSAQRAVAAGDTIRLVWAEGTGSLTGIVRTASDSEVVVRVKSGDERQIPASLVRSLMVREGSKPATGKGVRIGLFVGVIAGVGLGVATVREDESFLTPGPELIPAFAVAGGLAGAFWGAIVGSLSQADRWIPARFPDEGQPVTALGVQWLSPAVGLGVESTLLVGLRLRR